MGDELRAALAAAPSDVVAAYLFGSEARGTARPDSDIDLGLLCTHSPTTLHGRFGLESTIEQAMRRPVQVVVLNDAPPDLVHRVLRDGKLLLDRDRAARIRFEVAARNAFFDLAPILERYRHGQRAEGGLR